MDRLTYRVKGHAWTDYGARMVEEKLAAYEDTGLTPERCAELAKAEQEGLLAISPPIQSGRGWVKDHYGEAKEVEWRTVPFDYPVMSAVDGSFYNLNFYPSEIKKTREEVENEE